MSKHSDSADGTHARWTGGDAASGRRLPRHDPHARGAGATRRETPCVLIVEDDPDDRDLYGLVLVRSGFDVLFADDYDTGLQLAHAVRPDAILLDLGLPGQHTGLELCIAVRRSHLTARLPIIILTGFAETRLGDAARLAGCTTYMEKPASPLAVLGEVQRLTRDRRITAGD